MSPTSSPSTIYDHLMINFPHQPKIFVRNGAEPANGVNKISSTSSSNSKSTGDRFSTTMHRKSIPPDEPAANQRRYTITQMTVTEPKVRCSVSNQIYDKIIPRKSPAHTEVIDPTLKTNAIQIPSSSSSLSSPSSSNIEVSQIHYRPLITNGRRRFTTLTSASPMVIVKKKSPSPQPRLFYEQVHDGRCSSSVIIRCCYFLETLVALSACEYNSQPSGSRCQYCDTIVIIVFFLFLFVVDICIVD